MGTTVLMLLYKSKSKTPVHLNKLLNIRKVVKQNKMHTEEIHVSLPL